MSYVLCRTYSVSRYLNYRIGILNYLTEYQTIMKSCTDFYIIIYNIMLHNIKLQQRSGKAACYSFQPFTHVHF